MRTAHHEPPMPYLLHHAPSAMPLTHHLPGFPRQATSSSLNPWPIPSLKLLPKNNFHTPPNLPTKAPQFNNTQKEAFSPYYRNKPASKTPCIGLCWNTTIQPPPRPFFTLKNTLRSPSRRTPKILVPSYYHGPQTLLKPQTNPTKHKQNHHHPKPMSRHPTSPHSLLPSKLTHNNLANTKKKKSKPRKNMK